MPSYYLFNPKNFHVSIVLYYSFNKTRGKVILHELNMYKNREQALKYIKAKNLRDFEDGNDLERTILNNIDLLFQAYFSGETKNIFSEIQKLDVDLDLDQKFKSAFSKKVSEEIIKVRPGETTSYHAIGNKIGSKAYRAIGNACKSNPIPLIVPCHRVLKKNGELGGFMGKTDKEWETNLKKELLKLEGVGL